MSLLPPATPPHWQTARFLLTLERPLVMGIVNCTPDSFSDGGHHPSPQQALRHAEQLLKDGADILDIGGESTRPEATPVPLDVELARVLPVVREAVHLGVPISVDTYKPEVMNAVLDVGADIINDIWALRRPGATAAVASHPTCGVCLMHMHGDPQTMQLSPMTGDPVPQVRQFLEAASRQLQAQGVQPQRIVLDPGIGFGKTPAQNFTLLLRQSELLTSGWHLLAGWSRKSSIAVAIQRNASTTPAPADRMAGSVAAALLAVDRGARIVRVHDVSPTVQALAVWQAMQDATTTSPKPHTIASTPGGQTTAL